MGPARNALRKLARLWRWLLLVGLALAVAALIVAIPIVEAHFGASARSCTSCHVDAARDVHASEHKDQPCSACHESRVDQNLNQWVRSWLSDEVVAHGALDAARCKSCHTQGKLESWHLARTQGHLIHVTTPKDPLECTACHELSRHRTAPKPEACNDCHSDIEMFDHTTHDMPRGQAAPCLSCHEFLARTDIGAKTLATDCRRCHGSRSSPAPASNFAVTMPGQVVTPAQIHGSLTTCSLCHDPHAEDPTARRQDQDCTRCHDAVTEEHHAGRQPMKFDCSTCHSAHGDRRSLTENCRSCHQGAAGPAASLASEHDGCTQCHQAHEFVAKGDDGCKSCHEEPVTILASWNAKKHSECNTCHEPHSGRKETTLCASCHKTGDHGHESCTSCHEPHQNAANAKTCGSCHASEQASTLAPGSPHRDGCQSCHDPHASGKADASCRGCHRGETTLVSTARIEEHQRCESCHAPHRFPADQAACSTCHAFKTPMLHAGKCSDCHQVHGPPIGKAQRCANCHADVPVTPGAHRECNSCHTSAHALVTAEAQRCTGCHEPQAVAVSTWQVPTHQACNGCHQPHSATKPATCGSCHTGQAKEVANVPAHRCNACHDAHAPAQPQNLWGECRDCHGPIVTATAQRGPKHSACQSCHDPHTAAATTCNSCHQKLPAGHAIPGHERCNDCHDEHARTPSNRAQCLKCHTQQVNHFPEASTCAGCHLFK